MKIGVIGIWVDACTGILVAVRVSVVSTMSAGVVVLGAAISVVSAAPGIVVEVAKGVSDEVREEVTVGVRTIAVRLSDGVGSTTTESTTEVGRLLTVVADRVRKENFNKCKYIPAKVSQFVPEYPS